MCYGENNLAIAPCLLDLTKPHCSLTNLGQNQSVMLSNNDLKILQWVKSSEGKQTYKLFVENQQTLAACQEENRLKGYCLIQMQKNKK
ncbi:hypothetical protein LC609_34740 [Nostoc sp. XA013]|nr:hypothetical protein [Nostoc sp. XA013]